jgi:GNAT superfamily N-acetyltransferase
MTPPERSIPPPPLRWPAGAAIPAPPVMQAKLPAPAVPRAGRAVPAPPVAQRRQAPVPPPPLRSGRAPSCVQRSCGVVQANGLQRLAQRIYRAWSGEVVIIDDDGTQLVAYINGKKAGYVTYEKEDGGGFQVLRFGYIQVQPSFQGTKLSSLLLYLLSQKALANALPVVRVGHPDPGLAGYWEHIGFDMKAAKRHFYYFYRRHQADVPSPTAEDLRDTVAVHADAPSGRLLRLNQTIASTYWDIETDNLSRNHQADWYREQKEKLIAYNMYEGRVKPLHDYSSSYIS